MNMIAFENRRAATIKSSPSMAVSMAAKAMRARGENVLDLSLGEPDFDTPSHIVEAAIGAMRTGITRYTAPDGLPELRQAIVDKFRRENGLDYALDEISIGNGAKQILFNAFLGTLEPGDEVIVPAPYWVSYTDLVILHGGLPKVIACGVEDDFKITPERLEAAITPKTRWFLFNSPSNPTGAIYTADELKALGEVLARHPRVAIMSDEIYEHIVCDDTPFTSFAIACPNLRDRTLIINGVSKAYAMTGWRLGYAAGPKELTKVLNKLQSQSTTCPSSITQVAAAAALNGPQDFVRKAVAEYKARGELVTKGFGAIAGLEVRAPEGAFYLFPKCAAYIGKVTPEGTLIENDTMLASYLLTEGKVATVPGAAFGVEPYIRLSFATSRDNLTAAIERTSDALAKLR
ncbi:MULTISPECIES: pyridoxal phosphate-dependent aminotransferase [Brucella/Ochrobactrum group]|uniref:Aminotransferase n=1 Tax=Ochrobactrum soli TaxID=2448455 RepID=A0A849KMZ8_9HYPH|nr:MULTISPECIES: pyridoxal phosphate-dependent aminotransferase [Brucella]NNU61037.1 pyridoxal phosphate-dependent aminotransferase [[Ochrobactrum] soli]WHS29888.1 pyridoxal phosphate-dependent aminotransferase [Brucella sp. NM4]WHT44625.1 pyridoxal phosphate-dependent aminotransferase [Ochrobactrum sp. SSR]